MDLKPILSNALQVAPASTAGEVHRALVALGLNVSRSVVKTALEELIATPGNGIVAEVRPCVRNGRHVEGSHYVLAARLEGRDYRRRGTP